MTLSQLYQQTRRALQQQEDEHMATFLARQVMCYATGKTQEQLLAQGQHYASEATCDAVLQFTNRLLAGEPLAYILGQWEFYGMQLKVTPDVLIPRDDTCAVTELAIGQAMFLESNPRILDLCTGSGCIGLAIANRVKDAKVTLADISHEALQIARYNVTAQHLSGRVSCVRVDALEKPPAFLGKFDLIVSNPPYITTREMTELPGSVADFEPHIALHGGDEGLDFYRAITENFTAALKPGGYLCFEFGMGQADAVCSLLEENGYTILERSRDFNDRERAVLARYNRKDA